MDTKQPEALRLADAMERFTKSSHWWTDGEPIHIAVAAELRRMHTENETLRHKLQTLDELGTAGDDVQLLRMGYAAARLEIASLQAQAQQCGAGAGCCAQAARIGELEAQLEAVGAGGVGPLVRALEIAEAALADIGDADREPWDDVAWCEARAAQALPEVRAALITAAPQQAAQAQEDAGGWMRDGGMLYRLTDERRPTNFDEIRVTMANGSRDTGQLSAQAERLLVMLAAPQPPAQAQPVATIYVTEDGSREVDDWKVELPVGATTLYTAAQAQEDVPDMFWDADDTENFAHEIQDIVDGYGPGEIVTIECAKRMPNLRVLITGEDDNLAYEHIDAAIAAQQGDAA